MTTAYETLKNLNDSLNKIIAAPNIPANQKGKIILNLTRAIENISKSLLAYIQETEKAKKDREVKKELESERKAVKIESQPKQIPREAGNPQEQGGQSTK
jgi:hypothetical protein